MVVYYTVLGIILILTYIYRRNISKEIKNLLFWMCALLLIAVSGLRYGVGTDYAAYVRNYPLYLSQELDFFSQPVLSVVARISAFIYDDYATWFFLMAVITIFPVLYIIKRDSISFSLSIILFLFLGCWHYSFNIVKQSAAATILLFGYRYLFDRKLLKWCLVCAVASLLHISAIIMIPIYFLVNPKISKKRIIAILLIGVAVFLLYDQLFNLMNFLKQGSSITNIDSLVGSREVNILRILVNCVPIFVVLILRKGYNFQDKNFGLLFYLSLLNAVLNVCTINSVYLNRFCIYTNIFNILFIPYLMKPLHGYKRITAQALMMCLYFAYWSYDLYKGSTTVVFHWIFER